MCVYVCVCICALWIPYSCSMSISWETQTIINKTQTQMIELHKANKRFIILRSHKIGQDSDYADVILEQYIFLPSMLMLLSIFFFF